MEIYYDRQMKSAREHKDFSDNYCGKDDNHFISFNHHQQASEIAIKTFHSIMIGAVHDNNVHNLCEISNDLLCACQNYPLHMPESQLGKFRELLECAKEFECMARVRMDQKASLIKSCYIDRNNRQAKTPKELIQEEDAYCAKSLCEKIFELCTI